MSTRIALGVLIALSALFGCDEVNSFKAKAPQPDIKLGAGMVVLIAPGEVAKVYGPDQCEAGFEDNNLLNDKTGCILITGKDSVTVDLMQEKETFKEEWIIARSGSRYTLTRPNGFQVREPD